MTAAGSPEAPAGSAAAAGPDGRPARMPPQHDPACWGCGDAPGGIRLPRPVREGDKRYEGRFRFDERHQGGPGLVHGGLVAAALDEACGLLATWYRFPSVTARFGVRFHRPVPIRQELTARAELRGSRGRRLLVHGELLDADGVVLASARGLFAQVPLEHFLVTPEGRAIGEAWRKRLAAGPS